MDKELLFLAGEIKTPPFSSEARIEAGFLLRQLQQGENLSLPQSRPMPEIGPNCHELRIKDVEHEWRIVYHIDDEFIVILEIFAKKVRQTPRNIIEVCQQRLKRFLENSTNYTSIDNKYVKQESYHSFFGESIYTLLGASESQLVEWTEIDDEILITNGASALKWFRCKRFLIEIGPLLSRRALSVLKMVMSH